MAPRHDPYSHIVGRWQIFKELLGFEPRGICGASLVLGPGERDPGPDAPVCPRCRRKNRRRR
jgi:hypothetical protein